MKIITILKQIETDCRREYIKIDKTKYKLDNMYNKIKEILQSNSNTKINEIEQFILAFEM